MTVGELRDGLFANTLGRPWHIIRKLKGKRYKTNPIRNLGEKDMWATLYTYTRYNMTTTFEPLKNFYPSFVCFMCINHTTPGSFACVMYTHTYHKAHMYMPHVIHTRTCWSVCTCETQEEDPPHLSFLLLFSILLRKNMKKQFFSSSTSN